MTQMMGTMRWNTTPILIIAVALLLPAALMAAQLTDTRVADWVADELMMDPAVPSFQIDVSTNDGMVTLSGSVDNALARKRAAAVAETVKGVRGVVNNIAVVPPRPISDDDIETDVHQALTNDSATEAYEVDVSVEDHVVRLTGEVDSWQEKRLCGIVARGVRGVIRVENKLRLNTDGPRQDGEIRREIEESLRWDALVDDALIRVRSDDGRVSLSGTVGSAAEKTRAVNHAYTSGVKTVSADELEVRLWARQPELRGDKYAEKNDDEIRAAIQDALRGDPRVPAARVDLEVAHGTVTLRGTLDDLKARRVAENHARRTVGVQAVENRLKVRPSETGALSLGDRVEAALQRDPYVDRYAISVMARVGVVNLYGTVPTYYQKAHADDVVSRVRGVIAVNNRLVVSNPSRPYAGDPYVDQWRIQDYAWYRHRPRQPIRSDAAIKATIEKEFEASPFVEADQITLVVEDGVATLTGRVNSWSERNTANENALEGGATDVRNNLILK